MTATVTQANRERAKGQTAPRKRTIADLAQYLGQLDATNMGADEAVARFLMARVHDEQIATVNLAIMRDVLEAYAFLMQQADVKINDSQELHGKGYFG